MIFENPDFNLEHTFECGQCFRWDRNSDGSYTGVVGNSIIKANENGKSFNIECDNDELVKTYFDLDRDYGEIKTKLSGIDDVLPKAIPEGEGIRLLKQNPWETLISFIISANNNIPRIKKIINSLCTNFGSKIEGDYYTFPDADVIALLTVKELDVIKSGFRAKYIIDAAQKVISGEVDLEKIYGMDTYSAREYLKQIKGVGNKVADCILLFAYQKFDVFPKDVWTKKVLHDLYGVEDKDFETFIVSHFGELAGFAQQYLFYYMRG